MLLLLHLKLEKISMFFYSSVMWRGQWQTPDIERSRAFLRLHLYLLPQHSLSALSAVRIFIWELKTMLFKSYKIYEGRLIRTKKLNHKIKVSIQTSHLPIPDQVLQLLERDLARVLKGKSAVLGEVVQVLKVIGLTLSMCWNTIRVPGDRPPVCCWRDCTPALSWGRKRCEIEMVAFSNVLY